MKEIKKPKILQMLKDAKRYLEDGSDNFKLDNYNTNPDNFTSLKFDYEEKTGYSGARDLKFREKKFYFRGGYYLVSEQIYPKDFFNHSESKRTILAGMLESEYPKRTSWGGCATDDGKLVDILKDNKQGMSLRRVVRNLGFCGDVTYCLSGIMVV